MIEEKKNYINKLFDCIVDEISISDTMLNKAKDSYEAVGKWLGECDPNLDVKIMPQGSINLGTVIKPISDNDDYDIDLVCLLKNGYMMSASQIKGIVGKRLKEHKKYNSMLDEEGKRCWTLQYDEFHMDILPSVPKDVVYIEPNITAIRLTHKLDNGSYIDKYSNPTKYKQWFEGRMESILIDTKRTYAAKNKVEIDAVPTYAVKTPLQKAIQLLKRHRDITFGEDKNHIAPISIIITTLAAEVYNNENNVYDALNGILSRMQNYIVKDKNGVYKICNPVMQEENFAEKWNVAPEKAIAFFSWLNKAKEEIVSKPMILQDNVEQGKLMKACFGENVTNRAYKRMAEEMKTAINNNNLYVNGLKGGITTSRKKDSIPVQGHTFYGK